MLAKHTDPILDQQQQLQYTFKILELKTQCKWAALSISALPSSIHAQHQTHSMKSQRTKRLKVSMYFRKCILKHHNDHTANLIHL